MNAKWGWLTQLGIPVLLFVIGCRTPQPDLKPAKEPEVFNPPPANVSPNYPKEAFRTEDPSKRNVLDPGGFMPSRGNSSMSPTGSFGGPQQQR
jgi:hypothetical protein